MIIDSYRYPKLVDPHWANTKLLMHMEFGTTAPYQDRTFTDSTGNISDPRWAAYGGPWYPQGDCRLYTAQAKFGLSSMGFDGNNDYIYVINDNVTDMAAESAWTIEAWIYPTTLDGSSGTGYGIVVRRFGVSSYGQYLLYVRGDGSMQLLNSFNGTSWGVNLTSAAGVIAVNTWSHVAMVRNGNDFSIYANGSRVATVTTAGGNLMTDSNQYITFGGGSAQGGFFYIGYIDELRITKSVARYTGTTYTVPTAPFPHTST